MCNTNGRLTESVCLCSSLSCTQHEHSASAAVLLARNAHVLLKCKLQCIASRRALQSHSTVNMTNSWEPQDNPVANCYCTVVRLTHIMQIHAAEVTMLLVMLTADDAEQMHNHFPWGPPCMCHTTRRWPGTNSHSQAEFQVCPLHTLDC